jgi:hypothetical protein
VEGVEISSDDGVTDPGSETSSATEAEDEDVPESGDCVDASDEKDLRFSLSSSSSSLSRSSFKTHTLKSSVLALPNRGFMARIALPTFDGRLRVNFGDLVGAQALDGARI